MSLWITDLYLHLRRWWKENIKRRVVSMKEGLFFNKTLLCVDDDPDFCRLLESLVHSMGFGFDKALTLAEARKKMEENQHYFAFILDGYLPDGSGFDLAKYIRETRGHKVPIGFVSRIYQDAVSFRILKENLKVDYVLEKPLRPEDMENFLRSLCAAEEEPEEDYVPDELLDDLKKKYEATIGEKIERIEKGILALQNNPTKEALSTLKNEVHKIAGSAGSYGYEKVSLLCADLDEEIKEKLLKGSEEKLTDEWLNGLDDFYSKIKLYFQIKK